MGEDARKWRREIGIEFDTLEEMDQALRQLIVRRHQLRAVGDQLLLEFRHRFPDSPVYLTRYADRTLNDYRWRRSSARRWRGSGSPERKSANVTLDLTGEAGVALLQTLPQETRRAFLTYEQRRVELNFACARVSYQRMRLEDLLNRRRALAQLREKLPREPSE